MRLLPRVRPCQYGNFIPQSGWGRWRLQSVYGLLARKTIENNKYNSDVSDRIDKLAPPARSELVKNVLKIPQTPGWLRSETSSSSKELIVYDLKDNNSLISVYPPTSIGNVVNAIKNLIKSSTNYNFKFSD